MGAGGLEGGSEEQQLIKKKPNAARRYSIVDVQDQIYYILYIDPYYYSFCTYITTVYDNKIIPVQYIIEQGM